VPPARESSNDVPHSEPPGSRPIRTAFESMASAITPLLAHPSLALRWQEPSALERWTNADLTAHLVRAVMTALTYLGRDDPGSADPMDAAGYLLGIDGLGGGEGPDLDSELHLSIHERARTDAEPGLDALRSSWEKGLAAVHEALHEQPAGRQLTVLGGRPITLDQYLVTRMVELAVHADDLATSLGVEPPAFEEAHIGLVVECLVSVARRRHGDLAVLRALTRTERDTVNALRVL
jgi:uncharacterized protein (TIGR03083 family)